MTATRVAVLTPPGTGAIATVEVAGDHAWEFARKLFRPAGQPLPESPEMNRFWFGRIGDEAGDEVILAATHVLASGGRQPPVESRNEENRGLTPPARQDTIEIHCHGGRRVVRWVVEQFVTLGCVADGEPTPKGSVLHLLRRAPTLRTASILLDQLHGAFDRAIANILATPDLAGLRELAAFASIGRHLVEPWNVVVAGPPNVGKSSLVNALAGYQRAVVSEVAGTTRDAVSVPLAFDGWPVELTDTAGLRDATGLEAEGIERARRVLAGADLVVWLMDAVAPVADVPGSPGDLIVWNKSDLAPPPSGLAVSAKTGAGIPALVSEIVTRLVPHPPSPGAAVPYTPQLADAVEAANAALVSGNVAEATRLLRDCLASR